MSQTPNGIQYRLQDATFDITGAATTSLSSTGDPGETALSATLPVGTYGIALQAGWTLERLENAGYVPVVATLSSPNPATFGIWAGTTTAVVFQFATDGLSVDLSDGTLTVNVEVVPSYHIAQSSASGSAGVAEGIAVRGSTAFVAGTSSSNGGVLVRAGLWEGMPYEVSSNAFSIVDGYVRISAVAIDASGRPVVAGEAWRAGGLNQRNLFVARFDEYPQELWRTETVTVSNDLASGVAFDASDNVFVVGFTAGRAGGQGAFDVLLAKYDPSGISSWERTFGTSGDDKGLAVAVDAAGSAFIVGSTSGSLGGATAGGDDAFLAKYDAAGNQLWVTQFGTAFSEDARGVALDASGNIFVTGCTGGDLGGLGPLTGGSDAYLAKFTAAGTPLWARQLASPGTDWANGVAVDAAGNAYVAGWTDGALAQANQGGGDFFVARYDGAGTLVWARQFGTTATDEAVGVGIDQAGDLVIGGYTRGSLGGPASGTGASPFVAVYGADGTLH